MSKLPVCKIHGGRFACALAVFILFTVCGGALAASTNLITKGPYLQMPGEHTMTVMWESLTNHPGAVRYGLNGILDHVLSPIEPLQILSRSTNANPASNKTNSLPPIIKTNVFFLYAAILNNLERGKAYSYSVELDDVKTRMRTFSTFGPDPDKLTFIVYGDSRTQPKVHAALASQFKQFKPEFILHTGDLVEKGERYEAWTKEFFAPLSNVIDEIPMFCALGNHEESGSNYLSYFHLPNMERYYAFDDGPLHVLALDYHYEKASQPQFLFASNDLAASHAPWKLVLNHYPTFNIGHHDTAWGHKTYLPLFHKMKVDLVVAGHSHIYERFHPIAPKGEPDSWPITCITSGGGGAELGASYDHPAHYVWSATNHFMVFEVTRDTLRAKTITAAGKMIDSFEIKKENGAYTAGYLAEVFSEELVKMAVDVATNLTGRLSALPTNNTTAYVLFNVAPMRYFDNPVELEISLMPYSDKNYELVDGPIAVHVPTSGTNQNVWGRIRYIGTKELVARDTRELSPGLLFQAKVKSDAGETLARGQRSRLSVTAANESKKLVVPAPNP